MRTALFGLIALLTIASFQGIAWGTNIDISASTQLQISGQNSSGDFIPLIGDNQFDTDFEAASAGSFIEGGTDLGVATARAAALGSHNDTRKLIKLQVAGSARISRPALTLDEFGFLTPGRTGSLHASAPED